jgi:hypothetical protein
MKTRTPKLTSICFLIVTSLLAVTALAQYQPLKPEPTQRKQAPSEPTLSEVQRLKAQLRELMREQPVTPEGQAAIEELKARLQRQQALRLSKRSPSAGQGLLLTPLAAPANDDCVNAIDVTPADFSFTDTQDTTMATEETDEPQSSCGSGVDAKSVWYGLTNPFGSPFTVNVNTNGSSFDTVLAVYPVTGAECDLASFAEIACDDDAGDDKNSALSFTAQPGVLYKIQVIGFNGAAGNLIFNVSSPDLPPNNDHCANEIDVTNADLPFTDAKDTTLATDEPGEPEPGCGNDNDGKGVWYSFTNTTGSTLAVNVNTTGSDYDTVLAVYRVTGAECGFAGFVEIACNDDTLHDDSSELTFLAQPGVLYKIQVTGFESGPDQPESGNLVFNIPSAATPLENDDCATAIAAPCQFTDTKDTTIATDEPGEPEPTSNDPDLMCGGPDDAKSVWYEFTNPSASALTVNVDTIGSDFDTVLAVYEVNGGECDFADFARIACADNRFFPFTTTLTFTAQPGVVYKIQANGLAGDAGNLVFNLSVDEPPPIPICPANITQSNDPGQCGAVVNYPAQTNAVCPDANPPSCAPPPGSFFAIGTTTVTCTASLLSCSFTVTVNDTEPPNPTCPTNIVVTASAGQTCASATYTTPSPNDNCSSAFALCFPPSGFCFPLGVSTVTCSANDLINTATCTFTVTVNEACSIVCPSDIVRSTDPGQCGAVVNYSSPTTTGGCGTVTCTPASGSFFQKGTTTVTCTTTAGPNCSFTVTVNDTEPPSVTCSNVTATANPGDTCKVVTYTTPTASDNCGSATVRCSPPSGDCFAIGTTTVTCTANDNANTTDCTFTVTVTVQPCTLTCPANITRPNDPGQCGAVVTYSAPTTTGACGTVTCSPPSGSFFSVGTTTVTCSSTAGPSCSFTVRVNDTQPPTVTCPPNKTVSAGAGCVAIVSVGTATASDNCAASLAVTGTRNDSQPLSAPYPLGVTTIIWKATDAAGQMSTCAQTITVTNTAPTANAGPDQTVSEGATVILNGTGADPNPGQTLTFQWMQTSGPAMILTGANTATATFAAPLAADLQCVALTFQLKVTDSCGAMATDTVVVTVGDLFVLQDDRNGHCVVIRRSCAGTAATYCWRKPDGSTVSGPCTITVQGNTVNAQSTAADPNLFQGLADLGRRIGNARLTETRANPARTWAIADSNTLNSTCSCQ